VGRKRVARLMQAAGLKGLQPQRSVTTTVTDPAADRALDQVERRFTADGPDRPWVVDITCIPTRSGFPYLAESFFATLEREALNRRRFPSQAEARMAIFQWLEGWHNPHRRHSSLGYLSPINDERRMLPGAA
jgi:putative transposase